MACSVNVTYLGVASLAIVQSRCTGLRLNGLPPDYFMVSVNVHTFRAEHDNTAKSSNFGLVGVRLTTVGTAGNRMET